MDLPYLYTGHARDLSLVLNLHCYTIRFWNSLSHLQKELFLRKFKKQPQNSNKSQGTRVTKLQRTIDIAVSNQNPNRNLLWEKKKPFPPWLWFSALYPSDRLQKQHFPVSQLRQTILTVEVIVAQSHIMYLQCHF